jgi:O-acetylhomoserine (thiol)-lyase
MGLNELDFAEDFGPAAFIMRARLEGLRDFGGCLSPGNAFYLLQGLETLPLRMRQHVSNAQAIAEFLAANPAVSQVTHAGLPTHPDYALAQRLMPRGAGAVFSFEIKGGRAAGRKFIDALQLFSHLANVGDAKSLVIHPASTTHARLDAAALERAGISEGLVRLSIGLEDPQDLIDDLARALGVSQK